MMYSLKVYEDKTATSRETRVQPIRDAPFVHPLPN